MEDEHPVCGGQSPAFHFHSTLARVQGPALVRDQVVQVGQAGEKRLLMAVWMVKRFHHAQLPLDGIMRLIQQGAGCRHLGGFEHGIPAGFLLPKPAPDARAVGGPRRGGAVVHKVTEALAERQHPQALALARPGQQGVELCAQGLADRGGDGGQFPGELIDGVAETVAEAYPREQRPPTARRAVKAIGQEAADAIRWILLERRLLKRAV